MSYSDDNMSDSEYDYTYEDDSDAEMLYASDNEDNDIQIPPLAIVEDSDC